MQHCRVTCPGTRPGVSGNLWGRTRCARHTRVGWRHLRTTSVLAHAAARAVTERQVALHNVLEGLRGGGGRHSVTEATGLLLQAVGAGVCWTDAVEALVDVDASQGLVNLQGAAVPVPAFASFPASVVMCGEPAPVVVVLHQLFGLRQRDCQLCTALSQAGCVAIAPDLHATLPRAPLARLAALSQLDPTSRASLAPLHALMDWIEQQPWGAQRPSLALVGCGGFGGGLALQLASLIGEQCSAVCAVDGAVIKDVAGLSCPVLGLFTDKSQRSQAAEVEALMRRSHVQLTTQSLPSQPQEALVDRVTAECLRFLERQGVVDPPGAKFTCSSAW